ncbi:hypothetical protein JB92DRAFT_2741758 [Gautieria morchelliformis]|nr:hypothetical protein JB92DRAFT_2741758 [Gautieria morchelliformis]
MAATVGLLVPLEAKSDKVQAVSEFLVGGRKLVDAEPETIQWYGVKLPGDKYAIFDTFASESGRKAHLNGKVAEALMANASALLASGPAIAQVDILASLVRPPTSIEAKVGLYVPLVAKPEKAEAVKDFLISALPLVEQEPGTLQWFAYRKSETEFGIFDTSPGESGRNAHLDGAVAAALMANAAELLAAPPNIQKFDILALRIVV